MISRKCQVWSYLDLSHEQFFKQRLKLLNPERLILATTSLIAEIVNVSLLLVLVFEGPSPLLIFWRLQRRQDQVVAQLLCGAL